MYSISDDTIHFQDRRCAAASLPYNSRTEITVLMREQRPYPAWFSCQCKIERLKKKFSAVIPEAEFKTFPAPCI